MPADEPRIPNTVLIALRERAGLSQQDLADELTNLAATRYGKHPQIIRKTIGRWERGEVVWPQPFYRRLLAEYFRCAADELGFRRQPPVRSAHEPTESFPAPFTFATTPAVAESRVERDQDQWRQIRSALGRHRRELAVVAESLYRDHRVSGLKNTGVISSPAWIPAEPVPLDEIILTLDSVVAEPTTTGEEPDSAAVRPLASIDARYRRYHDAIRDLAAPRLFENRLCFRLLELDWTHPHMRFG